MNSAIINLEKGKIPPQAVDLEEVVLGAILIDEKGMQEVADFIRPDHFYKDAHRYLYEACYSLFQERNPIDLITVSQQLRKMEKLEAVGGDHYVIGLTQKVASSAHIEYHSRIIVQKYIQRSLIKFSNRIIELSYSDDVDAIELIEHTYSQLNTISSEVVGTEASRISELTEQVIEKGRAIFQGDISPGISTPITNLTNKMGGFRSPELIILAARPGMGKTSFALSCAVHAAKLGIPSVFFSLEMDKEQMVSRILSSEAEIPGDRFNSKGLDNEELIKVHSKVKEVNDLPIFIDDTDISTVEQVRIKANKLKNEHGIGFIIIDYLQLMSSDAKSREQEIAKISRGLKLLAKELKIPVIALSQLTREVEKRPSKRPQLSDLRESGAIEQDADVVMFLFRPQYYSIKTWDAYGGIPTQNEAEYIVAKNRNGGLVKNRMKFIPFYTKFEDLPKHEREEIDNQEKLDLKPESDEDDLPF